MKNLGNLKALCQKIYKALEENAAPMNLRHAITETKEKISLPKKLWLDFIELAIHFKDDKLWYLSELPDLGESWQVIYGEPNGEKGVGFASYSLAVEFLDAANNDELIRTPIACHPDDCPGCADIYFSRTKQELIAVCNECGMKREFLTNPVNCGDLIGSTRTLLDVKDKAK